jgi:hypothetical protein
MPRYFWLALCLGQVGNQEDKAPVFWSPVARAYFSQFTICLFEDSWGGELKAPYVEYMRFVLQADT